MCSLFAFCFCSPRLLPLFFLSSVLLLFSFSSFLSLAFPISYFYFFPRLSLLYLLLPLLSPLYFLYFLSLPSIFSPSPYSYFLPPLLFLFSLSPICISSLSPLSISVTLFLSLSFISPFHLSPAHRHPSPHLRSIRHPTKLFGEKPKVGSWPLVSQVTHNRLCATSVVTRRSIRRIRVIGAIDIAPLASYNDPNLST